MPRPTVTTHGTIVLWGLIAGLGYVTLGGQHASPGAGGSPLDRWPTGSSIPLDTTLPTLLIFIHPRCPCSKASLAELEALRTRCLGRFAAQVVTFRPDRTSKEWDRAEERVDAACPGLSHRSDPGGREAARFGVRTSGHVLLFNPSGTRLFSGGITISRGHRGDNPGLDRLIGSIVGGSTVIEPVPVFGCPVLPPGPDRSAEPSP